jgi:outer membrane protein OmpA-like peptidoglycan-associated protein
MRSALLIALILLLAGCAKQNAVVQATPTAPATETATAAAAETATPQAAGSETPSPTPTPTPTATPTPRPDLLTFEQGAMVRVWPATATGYSPGSFLLNQGWLEWRSREAAISTFVFEFPVPTSVESLELSRKAGTPPPSGLEPNTESIRLEGSSTSAGSGYADIGTFQIKADNEDQKQAVTPVKSRWLRVTITPPSGQAYADLMDLRIFGTPEANAANGSLAGTWILFWNPAGTDDSMYAKSPLPDAPDWKTYGKTHDLWKIVQKGDEFRGIECNDDTSYHQDIGGTQDGARITWEPIGINADRDPATLYPEGDVIVGGGHYHYIAIRTSDANACRPPTKPLGNGKKVLVLQSTSDAGQYYAYGRAEYNDPLFLGYHYIPAYVGLFQPPQLNGIDTVVLVDICGADNVLAKWQSGAINGFVAAGHKLIIEDSDACTKTGYSFLPYPFTTSNPGARGAHGGKLILVESSTLGSDKSDPEHFIDADAYAKSPYNQLGDANTVVSQDPHWCGHFFGTNVLNQNGFMRMFAQYGRGLIIYDGFDRDDNAVPEYQKLRHLELVQKVPMTFKCTQLVTTSFLISPSSERKYTPGVARTLRFPLDVLANQGYAGTVSLAVSAPANAPWHTALSKTQFDLKGDTKSLEFSIDVPAKVVPDRYEFNVVGTDAKGQTAKATITLDVSKPPLESAFTKSKRIRIYGIHFDFNSATVRPESGPVIKEIADVLGRHAEWKLTIEGHTDNVGGTAYNLDLSSRRAASVKTILVNQYHIAAARLSTVGYGLSRPVATNETDAGRALNRRVELVRQ